LNKANAFISKGSLNSKHSIFSITYLLVDKDWFGKGGATNN